MLGGEIENFRLGAFLTAASELVRCDEIERALWLLDNLPAYYRDNTPKEVTQLKNEILKRIATARFYSGGDFDCRIDPEDRVGMNTTLRGILLIQDVKHLNAQGITPHIYDLGPGPYHLPIMLKRENLKFTYQSIELNKASLEAARPYIGDVLGIAKDRQFKIFVATELIEHLHHEAEIKTEMLIECGLADIVHISTPRYTYDTRDVDWRDKTLGHLRAYTPMDFYFKVQSMFPEYIQLAFDSTILHSKLIYKKSSYFDKIKQKHDP